ncbi:hypothetical protein PFISCL1PPCAC_26909, partial [Pristionchus fissidentatus]
FLSSKRNRLFRLNRYFLMMSSDVGVESKPSNKRHSRIRTISEPTSVKETSDEMMRTARSETFANSMREMRTIEETEEEKKKSFE